MLTRNACVISTEVLMKYPEIVQGIDAPATDGSHFLSGTILEQVSDFIIPDVVVNQLSELAKDKKAGTNCRVARDLLRGIRKSYQSDSFQQTLTVHGENDRQIHVLPVTGAFLERLPWIPDSTDLNAMIAITALEAIMIESGIFVDNHWQVDTDFNLATFQPTGNIVLVTNSDTITTKARYYGVTSVKFYKEVHPYTGVRHVVVPRQFLKDFLEKQNPYISVDSWKSVFPDAADFHPNETIVMYPFEDIAGNYGVSSIGEVGSCSEVVQANPYDGEGYDNVVTFYPRANGLIPLRNISECLYRIPDDYPEIAALYNALHSKSIKGIVVSGPPGTGKTHSVISEGIELCKEGVFNHITILQSGICEIGALPGDMREKAQPLSGNITDVLRNNAQSSDEITNLRRNGEKYGHSNTKIRERVEDIAQMQANNFIEYAPIETIFGRSLDYQFVVVDEAQRISVPMMKTVISRAGAHSKIVVIGDTNQLIENREVRRNYNGLTLAQAAFEHSVHVAYIELNRGLRSDLVSDFNQYILNNDV